MHKILMASLAILLTISIIGISSEAVYAQLVPPADATLLKSVDKPIVVSGTNVIYSYKITNTGQNDIFCGSVTDNKIGNIPVNTLLKANQMTTVMSGSVLITGTQDVTNMATANCVADGGVILNPISSTTVDVVNPSATIDKTASKTQGVVGVDPLQVTANVDVFYAMKVTNNGDVALNNCQVSDPNLGGNVGGSFNLAPNAMTTVFSVAPKQYVLDFQNTASVSCSVPTTMGDSIGPISDTADVDVVNPSVTLDKTASKTQGVVGVDPLQVTPNVDVFYAFKATNNGDVALNNCQVSDPNLGGNVGAPFNLAANGGMNTVFSVVAKQYAADFQNTGTVTCDDVAMFTPTDTDTADVDVVDPMVTLDKTASKTQGVVGVDPLQVTANVDVFYAFKATNNGDVALNNCQVSDPNLGGNVGAPFNLAANGGMNTVFSVVAKQYAADFQNTGTVTCDDVAMFTPTDTDTADVDVVDLMLILEKTASETQGVVGVNPLQVTPGTNVFYAYKATSMADVPLNNCVVGDNLLGAVPGSFNLPNNGDMGTVFTTIPAIINQDTTNIGTVTCDPVAMVTPTAQSTAEVKVILEPCVDIVKMVDKGLIEEGEIVKYTFDITNCGEVPLKLCDVDDDKLGDVDDGDFSLAPSNSITFMKSVPINQHTKNTATVVCVTDNEAMEFVTDSDMAQVTVLVVGGEFLPINTAALFLGGIQSSAVWLVPALAGLAGTGYYLVKFRNKEE